MWTKRTALLLSLVCGVLGCNSFAEAQAATQNAAQPAAYQPSAPFPENYSSQTFYPTTELRALPGARAAAAVAWAQYHQAETDLSLLIYDAQRRFNKQPEIKQAKLDEQQAWQDFNESRTSAVAGLKDDPSYKASMELQEKISRQIREVHESDAPPIEKIIALASLRLTYSATTTAMEAAAVSSDSHVKSARDKWLAANRHLAEVQGRYDETVRGDAQIIAARHNLSDSRIAAIGADATYIEAARVADAGLDFAYHLYQHPYPNAFNPYGSGGIYGGTNFQVGYPIGYPLNNGFAH